MTPARRVWLWGPVLTYMAIIFFLSAQPDIQLPGPGTDKPLHSMGYAGLGGLVARATAGGLGRPLSWRRAIVAVGLTTAYGATDEWHQSFVPGRDADLADVSADAVGAVAATAACWAWGIIRSRSDV